MRAVYFFCDKPEIDPVAHRVFQALSRDPGLDEAGIEMDGNPVMKREEGGHRFYFCRIDKVLSHDYVRYLPLLTQYFNDFDFAGLVNWHQGGNAPDAVFCVHTTGDVVSGQWGPATPVLTRALLLAIERNRREQGLDLFRTIHEATHWSGVPHGGRPEMIPLYRAPLVDIEIGSNLASWSDERAVEVVARSLLEVFAAPEGDLRSLLCVGGVHLEPSYTEAVLRGSDDFPFATSHVLANQWIVAGGYEGASGLERLDSCVASISGGVHAIAFHDNLKGMYKDQVRTLAQKLGIPCFKHQKLERPQLLDLW
jgi:D-tyrosyl-tRNA(Tyr) deacylase